MPNAEVKIPELSLMTRWAAYLEWEREDYEETVEAPQAGYEDVRAGRTKPAAEFLRDLRVKHDFPG